MLSPALDLILRSPPGWVLQPGGVLPAVDIDLANSRTFPVNSPLTKISCTRTAPTSGSDYVDDLAGIWYPVAGGIPRITNKGCLVEESRINIVLWNRDLTNAAWTKSNVTAALDQTGIDGVANSASSIIATSGNGTCLQAITLASSARWQTAFVKRITGSGVINMTTDNGSTWTAVTVTSTTTWTRVAIPTQTLANPTVGFRIVTSGDKIAVDFVQNENSGVLATSPILVTTAAVTRNADVITLTNPPSIGSALSFFASYIQPAALNSTNTVMETNDGSSSNINRIFLGSAVVKAASSNTFNGGSNQGRIDAADAFTANTSYKAASALTASDRAIVGNRGTAGTSVTGIVPSNMTAVQIGGAAGSQNFLNSYVTRFAIWPSTRLTNAQMQVIT